MAHHTTRSARKELRALIERALAKEDGLSEAATRRVVNRILRQSGRIAEISGTLRAAETPVVSAEMARPAAVHVQVQVEARAAFDPYCFGAVVTLQRLGPNALLARLAAITRVEDLRSFAVAQSLALPAGWSSADELRAAIVRGAEERLAERRAAAS